MARGQAVGNGLARRRQRWMETWQRTAWHECPKPNLVTADLFCCLRIWPSKEEVAGMVEEAGSLSHEEFAHGVRHLRRQDEDGAVPVELVPLTK